MRVRYTGVIACLVLAAAACGSSSSKAGSSSNTTTGDAYSASPSSTAAETATTAASSTGAAPVSVASVGEDKLFVASNGRTVYAFNPDTATASQCNAPCDKLWPPVTVTGTPPSTIGGVKITTLTRSDGTKQVVVNGHPVYTFASDTKAGDTKGQGIGGMWYYVNSNGEPDKG